MKKRTLKRTLTMFLVLLACYLVVQGYYVYRHLTSMDMWVNGIMINGGVVDRKLNWPIGETIILHRIPTAFGEMAGISAEKVTIIDRFFYESEKVEKL